MNESLSGRALAYFSKVVVSQSETGDDALILLETNFCTPETETVLTEEAQFLHLHISIQENQCTMSGGLQLLHDKVENLYLNGPTSYLSEESEIRTSIKAIVGQRWSTAWVLTFEPDMGPSASRTSPQSSPHILQHTRLLLQFRTSAFTTRPFLLPRFQPAAKVSYPHLPGQRARSPRQSASFPRLPWNARRRITGAVFSCSSPVSQQSVRQFP